jgi:hypothetical protein
MDVSFRLSGLLLGGVAAFAAGQTPTQGSPSPQTPAVPSGFPIATDRPSFSDASSLIPVGRWQIETGGTYFRVGGTSYGQLPEFLLRVPVNDRFELRLVNVNYSIFEGGQGSGFQDPGIGFKLRLSRLNRKATGEPELALVGLLQAPLGGSALRANTVQPTVKLAAYVPVSATDGFGGNLVASYYTPDDAHFAQYAASLYWAHTYSPRLASFVEVYGLTPLSRAGGDGAFADAGFTYLLSRAVQIDVRYGSGFAQNRDGQFVGAGVAFRF